MSANQVTIEKLVFGGQALAHDNGQTIFLWNALPGETVEYEVLKKRKGIIEAVATKIISPSPDRIEPIEAHYLCCSPWSIMTPEAEHLAKLDIARETYRKIGNLELPDFDLIDSPESLGYRDKMEFSFTNDAAGLPSLAFFNRGTHRLIPFSACALAHPNINKVGEEIVAWVKYQGWTTYNLKSTIIRANSRGQVTAAVFIKDRLTPKNIPMRPDYLSGLNLYYSDHRSPASRPDQLMASDGDTTLTEIINGVNLSYGLFSFFQINIPVFLIALKDIARYVEPGSELVDYYSGVGTIGLALASLAGSVTLVESNAEASEFAEQNIKNNAIKNATAVTALAEVMLSYITPDATIIVDPPRAGLDKRVIERLLSIRPRRVIYLSCGPDTQARDLALLRPGFRPIFARLYNFFPRTPHLEALVALERV